MPTSRSLTIRRLTEADRNGIDKLRLGAASHLGADATSYSSLLRFIPSNWVYLDPNNERFVGIGAFDEAGQLLSFMTSIIDVHTSAWYIQLIMSSQEKRASKFNGIDLCTDWMIAYAEQRKLVDFWYSVPAKYARVHSTAWRKVTKLLAKYERNDVMVVPKYTRCADKTIWTYLLSESVLPLDMLIRHNHLPS